MVLLTSKKLNVGEFKAPDFNLPAVDGETYSLSSFKDKKGLVVVFTCNHCPYARSSWPLLIDLFDRYKKEGIGFVAINPNDSLSYPSDSFSQMKEKANEWKINFPYLRDKSQNTAKKYQAQCTPDIYVFDKDRKLYYHGRINDNWQDPENVTEENLKKALENLLSGKSPPKSQPPSQGCSIKWK